MDHSVLQTLNDSLFRHDSIEDAMLAYSNASQLLFFLLVVGLIVLAAGPRAVAIRRAGVGAALSAGLALAVAQVVSHLVDRARPFVTDPNGVHLFDHHVADPGFPSDHATAAFAVAVAVTLRSPRWGLPLLLAATLLAAGRVGLGVHYPSDVLGGALIGTMAAIVVWIPPLAARVEAGADRIGTLLARVLAMVRPGVAS